MLADNFEYRTNRLLIRFYQEGDFERWQELFSDMFIKQNQWDWEQEPLTDLTSERYSRKLSKHKHERGENKVLYFCVELINTNKLIGIAIINNIDASLKQAEIGFQLNNHYWGKGYGTEVALGVSDIGFGVLGHKSLLAEVNPNNTASRSIMHKLGFANIGMADTGRIVYKLIPNHK